MGLDMYAFTTKVTPASPVGFDTDNLDPVELHYWRKHPNLHGWMEALYRTKGGKDDFNCVGVVLTSEDLDSLEKAIKENNLPPTSGFFFGHSDGSDEEKEDDLDFIHHAREEIAKGLTVYYTSWW